MENSLVKIGLLDSGVAESLLGQVVRSACWNGQVWEQVSNDFAVDQLKHGSLLSQIIIQHCSNAEFYVAKVFQDKLTTTADAIAEGVEWLAEHNVDIINMSFGLREDRPALRNACELAVAKGICLVAASPSHGDSVYPSAYDGVVSVTGDARCTPDVVSYLQSEQADFGACAYWCKDSQSEKKIGGASFSVAHVVGKLASLYSRDEGTDQLLQALKKVCKYEGVEIISLHAREEKLKQLLKGKIDS